MMAPKRTIKYSFTPFCSTQPYRTSTNKNETSYYHYYQATFSHLYLSKREILCLLVFSLWSILEICVLLVYYVFCVNECISQICLFNINSMRYVCVCILNFVWPKQIIIVSWKYRVEIRHKHIDRVIFLGISTHTHTQLLFNMIYFDTFSTKDCIWTRII